MLNHINHKMPIYKDCTLFEVLAVSMVWLVLAGAFLSLLTWALFGFAFIGCAIVLISMVHTVRFLLGRLQKIKYGKPYGYYQQLFFKKASGISWISLFWQSPWLVKEDRWSVRRMHHDT
jgi:conjugative transfer region protein (TIGR03750 family)